MAKRERLAVSRPFATIVKELATQGFPKAEPQGTSPFALNEFSADLLRNRLKGTSLARRAKPQKESARRYIVAPKAAHQASGPMVQQSLFQIHEQLGTAILHSEHENGPKLLSITPTEALLLQERFSNLLIEEDVQLRLAYDSSPMIPQVEQPAILASGSTNRMVVTVTSGGNPVKGAAVILLLKIDQNRGYRQSTDGSGKASFDIRPADKKFAKVLVVPRDGHWSKVLYDIPAAAMTVDVQPVLINGFDWGQVDCQASSRGNSLGRQVKVAVIDSGIGPHPSLNVVDGNSWVGGTWYDGPEQHGTHCAGIIAALAAGGSTWGYAPDVQLYALRVFGGKDGGGFAYDIGNAIQWAIDKSCDIISMSFLHSETVGFLRQKIEQALGAGVLCVAAAGNDGGSVGFPASMQDVVGVSAIGKKSVYPPDSIHAEAESNIARNGYYFAKFSNHGSEIDFCAPGVAVTSTVPATDFAPWDGTSMACPHIAGIAALALNMSAELQGKSLSPARLSIFLDVLRRAATDLGFPKDYQGSGMPLVSKL